MTRPGPGKFEANESLEVSEFLYDIVGDSGQEDEIGDVESFGWHALITNIQEWLYNGDPLLAEHFIEKGVTFEPAYIVLEDNDGFFTYTGFPNNDEARAEWKSITEEFLEWMDNSDGVSVL